MNDQTDDQIKTRFNSIKRNGIRKINQQQGSELKVEQKALLNALIKESSKDSATVQQLRLRRTQFPRLYGLRNSTILSMVNLLLS